MIHGEGEGGGCAFSMASFVTMCYLCAMSWQILINGGRPTDIRILMCQA